MFKRIAIASSLALALASPGFAVDDTGLFYVRGAGAFTCERWMASKSEDKIRAEHWWAGYMTAANRFTPDTYDVLGDTSIDTMNGMLLRFCNEDSNQLFALAVHKALLQLHPNRTRKSPNR